MKKLSEDKLVNKQMESNRKNAATKPICMMGKAWFRTIHKKHVTHFHIINKIIIINTNTICCAHSSLNCEGEFLATFQCDWLGQVPTPDLRALGTEKKKKTG